jgi:hypothetical protein
MDMSTTAANASANEQVAYQCAKCKSEDVELETDPCGCMKWCKKCAMKVASGGKCKVCGEFYGGVCSMSPNQVELGEKSDDEA